MYAAIAVLLIHAIRFVIQRQTGGSSSGNGQSSRSATNGAWFTAVWVLLVPLSVMLGLLVLAGQIYLLPALFAVVALMFPWTITRLFLIPFGLPRLAYWLTFFTSDFTFQLDRRGGAALAGAWAIARQSKPDEEAAEWIRSELVKSETLLGPGILASGLLLSARGDLDGARSVIESVREIDERACPPIVRRLATGWLAADAAAQGQWLRVGELGMALGEGGREAWFLSGVAQCLLLEPFAPGRFGLWLRWAIAPHRRETLPIVRRALEALDGAFVEPDGDVPRRPAPATSANDDWSRALSLHASMLTLPSASVTSEDVRALGHTWDAVFDDRATERIVAERALMLGASAPQTTLDRLRSAVEGDLTAVVLAAGLSLNDLGNHGGITERVRLRVRDSLLSEIEAASDAIRRRVDDKRELPAIEEWREWTSLRLQYERGVRLAGQDFRRLAFYKVHPDGCSLAVWLFNDRKQRPLGNAIFKWLLSEAEAVEDERAIALQAKNVACGI